MINAFVPDATYHNKLLFIIDKASLNKTLGPSVRGRSNTFGTLYHFH